MLPLTNIRILITRTRHQASDLAAQLEALGATTILIPTIEIIPPENYAPLDAALAQLDTFDWILFTSANAVEVFHQRRITLADDATPSATNSIIPSEARVFAPEIGSGFSPGNRESAKVSFSPSDPPSSRSHQSLPINRISKVAAIGPATAKAVQGIGLTVDLIPSQYVAESLAEALTPQAPGKRMLLIRAAEARDILPAALIAAGAHLTIAEAYYNRIPPNSIPALQQLFSSSPHAQKVDAITFTSASTARNLVALLEAANLTLPPNIALASIGPITSQTLRELNLIPTLEALEPTIPALIQSLLTHFTPDPPY